MDEKPPKTPPPLHACGNCLKQVVSQVEDIRMSGKQMASQVEDIRMSWKQVISQVETVQKLAGSLFS